MVKFKINVLVTTYCQENVISRAIESVLSQGFDFFNKIIISDDHSSDNTWDVVQNFANNYPEKIEVYRNDINLGVYGNFNKLLEIRGDADFFYFLAGDDEVGKGWFKAVYDYIIQNTISISGSLGFFGDFLYVTANGAEMKSTINTSILESHSLYSLHLRGMVSIRSLIMSEEVLNNCSPVDTDKGIGYAESCFNNQCLEGIKKRYYLPHIGNVYYSGIGVSKNITKYDPEYFTNRSLIEHEMQLLAETKTDVRFLKSKLDAVMFIQHLNLFKLIKSAFNYVLGMKGFAFSYKSFLRYYKWLVMYAIKNRLQ